MDISTQAGPTTIVDVQTSGVSWPAIAAGAVTAAALTLMLIALGAGLGLSAVSPWPGSGVSGTTFKVGTGIYLLVVAVMASSVGGYLAARLRTRWTGLHTNEVFFRDTAHGLIAWALATLVGAAVLGSAATHIVGSASQALGAAATPAAAATQAAAQAGPIDIAVDTLFRTDPIAARTPAAGATLGADPAHGEIARMLTASFRDGGDLGAADRTYVARVVAARTGLSQADAEKRVNDVIDQTKQTLDRARKSAAELSLWLTASLLLGAFAASLAAVEGGQLRDGTWNERNLTPRAI
jgi:hypothetical protein